MFSLHHVLLMNNEFIQIAGEKLHEPFKYGEASLGRETHPADLMLGGRRDRTDAGRRDRTDAGRQRRPLPLVQQL